MQICPYRNYRQPVRNQRGQQCLSATGSGHRKRDKKVSGAKRRVDIGLEITWSPKMNVNIALRQLDVEVVSLTARFHCSQVADRPPPPQKKLLLVFLFGISNQATNLIVSFRELPSIQPIYARLWINSSRGGESNRNNLRYYILAKCFCSCQR